MFCNFSGMSGLHNYAQAKAYFDETEWPCNKTRGSYMWEEHQRPLDGKLKWHLRIERHMRGGQETFSLCLYQTEMVRYYPPGDDGFARVLLHTDGRNASSQFMWRSAWSTHSIKRYDQARKCEVVIPLTRNARHDDGYWSADLRMRNGTIDVSRSWHVPMAKRVTSVERKRERRTALKPVEHILAFAAQVRDSKSNYHPRHYINEHTLRLALADDIDAQGALMQWALGRNTTSVQDMKNELLGMLHLQLQDTQVPLPMFIPDADLPCNVKRLVTAD